MSGTLSINTAHNVTIDLAAATLGDRILAFFIDVVIKWGYVVLLGFVLDAVYSGLNNFPTFFIYILAIPWVFYNLGFEIFNNGQTPGKKAMKLQVSTLTGHKVSTGQYVIRWLFRMLDIMTMNGLIALISVAASNKNQRVGDIVAGTTVISHKQRAQLRDTIFHKISENYVLKYHNANTLRAADISTIKEAINSGMAQKNPALVKRLAQKVADVMQIDAHESSSSFLRQVIKDYNYLMSLED